MQGNHRMVAFKSEQAISPVVSLTSVIVLLKNVKVTIQYIGDMSTVCTCRYCIQFDSLLSF